MPIYANSPTTTTSVFHLVRVLPGAAGQKLAFEFFDAADVGSDSALGTVRVIIPDDATGTIPPGRSPVGCTSTGGFYKETTETLTACTATVQNKMNNRKLQNMVIPIPNDYSCNFNVSTGCWYKVEIALSSTVTDITTWNATVVGDPVRLVD